jgi:threonine dehydrogenase-like Zn-dependent dehydrogenase
MRAITIAPGRANSIDLESCDDPAPEAGHALVRAVALGVCGTDLEIIAGD